MTPPTLSVSLSPQCKLTYQSDRFGRALLTLAFVFGVALQCVQAQGVSDERFLKTSGLDIRNKAGTGEVMRLRGTNLGSWLVIETWMAPLHTQNNIPDEWTAWDVLTTRFGAQAAGEMIDVYRDNWIQASDLDRIKSYGMNCVRVPFWYRNFMNDNGTWRSQPFKYLDWIVEEAGNRGIYVILDFHGPQGGQSDSDSTGRADQNTLWTNAVYQDRTVEIWEALANRYKDEPMVAAYDLLNEPIGRPSKGVIDALHDRLYDAIRAIDPHHIISIEGTHGSWNWNVMPNPQSMGWVNVWYQMHAYGWGNWQDPQLAINEANKQVNDFINHHNWQTPGMIGEFNAFAGNPDPWDYVVSAYSDNNLHWFTWSFKTDRGQSDSWGMFNRNGNVAVPNLWQDSRAVIESKWASWTTANAGVANPKMLGALTMPVPADDSYSTQQGSSLSVASAEGVLVNDTHLVAGTPLIAELLTAPANGGILLNANGSFVYTPDVGFSGVDHFTYLAVANNGNGVNNLDSALSGKVTINVEPATGGGAMIVYASSEDGIHTAEKPLNGSTGWGNQWRANRAPSSANPEWWALDFGASDYLVSVDFGFVFTRTVDYEIEISNVANPGIGDFSNDWTTVVARKVVTLNKDDLKTEVLSTTARHVRIKFYGFSNGDQANLETFVPTFGTVLNMSATASSVNGSNTADKPQNGLTGWSNQWRASRAPTTAHPEWWKVDLGVSTFVGSIDFGFVFTRTVDYEIEVSSLANPGSGDFSNDWTTAVPRKVSTVDKNLLQTEVLSRNARHIRIKFYNFSNSDEANLETFEIFQ